MKYLFCSITLCIAVLSAAAQAPFSSWYAISYESPAYIPTFEKVDLLTGNRVLSVPLPYAGYFSDVHFFSRPGRYVVQLQDSLQDNYLVEIDTNGIVVRNTYIDSGPGTLTKYILPSFNSNFYYGLRLSSTAPGYEFFRLNPQSGLTTVLATMSNTGTVYADNAVINRRDELFFWSNDFMAGGDVLYRAEPSTQSIVALDTLPGPDRFFASIFDCYTSTIYGLIGDPFAGGGNWKLATLNQQDGTIDTVGTLANTFSQWRSNTYCLAPGPSLFMLNGLSPHQAMLFELPDTVGPIYTDPLPFLKLVAIPNPVCETPTAVDELDATPATFVYPNPVTSRPAVLRFPTVASRTVEVFDARGALVYRTSTRTQEILLPAQQWSRGIYNVRAVSGSEAETVRLVVEK